MGRRLRITRLVSTLIALALVAVACSDGANSNEQTTSTIDYGPLTLSCSSGETTQSSRSFGDPTGPTDPVAAAELLVAEPDSPDWWTGLVVASVRPSEGGSDLRVFYAQGDRSVQLIIEVRGPGSEGGWQASSHAACVRQG